MARRKRHTALKALVLQQNIQEDDSDAESGAEPDTSVYHEDNRDDSESESLISESSNSEISNFEDTKRFQKRMKITFNRIMQQALQLQLNYLGSFGP